jgi:hypothetical protein
MSDTMLTGKDRGATRSGMKRISVWIGAGVALTACVQVRAPEKPIEINLNVNVRQEVVVRLQQDAQDLIQNNPELFPQ